MFSGPAAGVNATAALNVHSIAIQVPISQLTRSGAGSESSPASVIGVWTTASRQSVRLWDTDNGENVSSGPYRQVSRLGNPLVNEVLIPLGKKDLWNSLPPSDDKQFASYVTNPELATLLPALYPGVFPNLAALDKLRCAACRPGGDPADRDTVRRSCPGSRTTPAQCSRTCSGSTPPSRPPASPNPLGVIGGDLAGYPNGRRVFDDVVTIELRAIAGATYPAGGQELHPRRGGRRDHRRADSCQRPLRLPQPVPLPRRAL